MHKNDVFHDGDHEFLNLLPRRFWLEGELPVSDLPEPIEINPDFSECTQEDINDENWVCPNRATWQIGYVCVCNDCYEKFWMKE